MITSGCTVLRRARLHALRGVLWQHLAFNDHPLPGHDGGLLGKCDLTSHAMRVPTGHHGLGTEAAQGLLIYYGSRYFGNMGGRGTVTAYREINSYSPRRNPTSPSCPRGLSVCRSVSQSVSRSVGLSLSQSVCRIVPPVDMKLSIIPRQLESILVVYLLVWLSHHSINKWNI